MNESRDFIPARRFEQGKSAVEIGQDYRGGRVDAAIDMGFSGEVDYSVG